MKLVISDTQDEEGFQIAYFEQLREIYEKNGNYLPMNHIFFDYFGRPTFNNNQSDIKYEMFHTNDKITIIVDIPGIPESQWEDYIHYVA